MQTHRIGAHAHSLDCCRAVLRIGLGGGVLGPARGEGNRVVKAEVGLGAPGVPLRCCSLALLPFHSQDKLVVNAVQAGVEPRCSTPSLSASG